MEFFLIPMVMVVMLLASSLGEARRRIRHLTARCDLFDGLITAHGKHLEAHDKHFAALEGK